MRLKTMNTKLLFTTLIASSIFTSSSSNATTKEFEVNFKTVADLTIRAEVAIDVGQNILGGAGTECTLAITTYPGPTIVIGGKEAKVEDTLTGAGCITKTAATDNNLAGIYEIKGSASQAITVTLGTANDGTFKFAPTGKINGTLLDMVSAGVELTSDSPVNGSLDTNGSATLIVGGVFTIGATTLAPGDFYSQDFNITAVY